jgi:MFS family permease
MSDAPTRSAKPRHAPGTAQAALAVPAFRKIFIGSFLSNVGTWMQNVLLGPFAFALAKRTGGIGPGTFAGIVVAAQLGPLLLAPLAGYIGDRMRRRPLLVWCQIEQLVVSCWLAYLVATPTPSKFWFVVAVLTLGIGNTMNGPAWSAMLPTLVGPDNVQGAVAVNSTVLNGSRVIGPLIVLALKDFFHVSITGIFVINAVTYLFVIYPLLVVDVGSPVRRTETFKDGILAGLRTARAIPVVSRILVVLAGFSILCLAYVAQFPAVAERSFHIDSGGTLYRWFYATWGLGACLGGLSTGTFLSHLDKRITARRFLVGFSISIAGLAIVPWFLPAIAHHHQSTDAHLSGVWPAFVFAFSLGFCYFAITTSMLTVLQLTVAEAVRARVMALWFMGFGGSVWIGGVWGGLVIDHASSTVMLLIGSAAAALLAWAADFKQLSERPRRELVAD